MFTFSTSPRSSYILSGDIVARSPLPLPLPQIRDRAAGREAVSNIQYAVRQGGMFVAKVDASDIEGEERAKREAMHYLAVYAQDGPCELWRRGSNRHWKSLGIRMGSPSPLSSRLEGEKG